MMEDDKTRKVSCLGRNKWSFPCIRSHSFTVFSYLYFNVVTLISISRRTYVEIEKHLYFMLLCSPFVVTHIAVQCMFDNNSYIFEDLVFTLRNTDRLILFTWLEKNDTNHSNRKLLFCTYCLRKIKCFQMSKYVCTKT